MILSPAKAPAGLKYHSWFKEAGLAIIESEFGSTAFPGVPQGRTRRWPNGG
jgi:hypothetical protein